MKKVFQLFIPMYELEVIHPLADSAQLWNQIGLDQHWNSKLEDWGGGGSRGSEYRINGKIFLPIGATNNFRSLKSDQIER